MIDGPGFVGFGAGALDWFAGLEANNEKPWFEANRAAWEGEVRRPLAALLEEAAARRGGRVKLFRLNRDVRFSADKSPYKTEAAGLVERDGALPLYVAISVRGVVAGAGLPMPSPAQLARLRAAIADAATGPAIAAALEGERAQGVEVWGEAVATAPRGFAKDHPRIAWLRMKQFLFSRRLSPTESLDGRRPLDFALETWARLDPALDALAGAAGL